MKFDQPYAAPRSPVCAQNIVATSQPLATQAGIQALKRGGNAVDAALAAAITLTVVEPCMNGVGSDAFTIIWDGKALHGLNGSGKSPKGWTPERFAGQEQMPGLGWDSVTVPGAVSVWAEVSDKFGSLAFESLFEEAIQYARDGFHVGPVSSQIWQLAPQMYPGFTDFAEHFFPAPQPGQLFRRPDLATTLEEIAATRGESFYRGALAQKIVSASDAAAGVMNLDDLAAHAPFWVDPVGQAYQDATLHEIPPNGQGLAAQIALGILNHLEVPKLDSPDSIHLQIEAMKVAIRAAFDHFADPDYMQTPVADLLDTEKLKAVANQITDRASPVPPQALPVSNDTVYLCTADASGMMVSFIQSNYMAFGSGVVVPGTGIALQNRGSGFTLEPGHPNQVGPEKRPFHTIIPGFVTKNGQADMAFGVMGGHMQAQGHVQMVTRIYDHQQNPQTASDAPRWIVHPDFTIGLEAGTPKRVLEDLAARGHQVSIDPVHTTFGGAQLIKRHEGGYIAGSDHRKEGCAAGF
ncbi:MAG: gamma-glutamyltransferase family protein [Pseudomonadota bacterium]